MSKKRKGHSSSKPLPLGVVPDRGSTSGSGEGMSDEEALEILRKTEPGPVRENPDIEVVVGAKEHPAQTMIPLRVEKSVLEPEILARAKEMRVEPLVPVYEKALKEAFVPRRVVISRADLHSSIRSVLDRAKALRLAEEALGKGESLRMRLLLDKSTIDVDLSRKDSDNLEATFSDLIDRSLG